MSDLSVEDMAQEVSALMAQRLHIRGTGLDGKLRRGGRLLPRKVRRAATYLAQAEAQASVPRLRVQLDLDRVRAAYSDCATYLKPRGAKTRRKKIVLDILTGIAVSVFVVGAIFLAVVGVRGLF